MWNDGLVVAALRAHEPGARLEDGIEAGERRAAGRSSRSP